MTDSSHRDSLSTQSNARSPISVKFNYQHASPRKASDFHIRRVAMRCEFLAFGVAELR